MTVIINVSNPHCGDTYIARAREFGITASSTSCRDTAAERCAKKVAGDRRFVMKKITRETWLAEIADDQGG